MRADVLAAYPVVPPERVRVIRNGIDTSEYAPDPGTDVLQRYGVDPGRPTVIFVGRITRQKGVPVLLRAASALDPGAQLVLCAGQPDTPEQAAEVTALVEHLQETRSGVIWLAGMLAKREVIQLLTHATVFACPSLYEPLGIVNLEAMACGTAVVASRVGGIPEVIADGETGLLEASSSSRRTKPSNGPGNSSRPTTGTGGMGPLRLTSAAPITSSGFRAAMRWCLLCALP